MPHAWVEVALTDHQRHILSRIAEGWTDAEIAGEIGISPVTIKHHVRRINNNLSTFSRPHAVAVAMSKGLIPFPQGEHS
jgi:DNA-binding NarL/FixJ family response regulator